MMQNVIGLNGLITYTSPSSTYINSTAPSAGLVRYMNSTLEVYDGYVWKPVAAASTTIDFSPEVKELLDWAREKKREETELNQLCENNTAIRDLVKEMNTMVLDYQYKINMVKALIQKEASVGTN